MSQMTKSSAEMGSLGGVSSTVAMGSEGRRVCTSHGSVDTLLCDLMGAYFSNNQEIAVNRKLVQFPAIQSTTIISGNAARALTLVSMIGEHPGPGTLDPKPRMHV